MNMKSNSYVFMFAFIVCLAASIVLSAVSEGLKPMQTLNAELEVKKNILKAVALKDPLPLKSQSQEILDTYQAKIDELVIDAQGNVVEGKSPHDIKEGEALYPLYIYREDGKPIAYCYPIVGQGLWSTLYGYLAIEADAITIRGITFYKHGETPGLGGEIEKDWFQGNFKGKTIWNKKEKKVEPIHIVKGKVSDIYKDERANHAVDGITAATLTSKGVTNMLEKWIHEYEPYFKKIRSS